MCLDTEHEIDYSYDDTSGDTALSKFSIGKAPSYVWSVLSDIKAINPYLRIIITPWSPVSRCRFPICPRRAEGSCLSRDG